MKMSERKLLARDQGRNIGEELLQAIRDVKAGNIGGKYEVQANEVANIRHKCQLSQTQFASALHISPKTLQQWEQGRRQPTGAAKTLLNIVSRHPNVLMEVTTSLQ